MPSFGDTVNTAARIESTSKKGRIQISLATANLLREAGKDNWVVPREERVLAKGIGIIQTCWLSLKASSPGDVSTSLDISSRGNFKRSLDKRAALVDWHTEGLARFLKVVVAQQKASRTPNDGDSALTAAERNIVRSRKAPIEEITEKIAFPEVLDLDKVQAAAESIELERNVMLQLRSFVESIAATYKDVPFHNVSLLLSNDLFLSFLLELNDSVSHCLVSLYPPP